MLNFHSKSEQRLKTHCYKAFSEECKSQIKQIYATIQQAIGNLHEDVDLLSLYTLLKQWELMVPLALLRALFKQANRITEQKPITSLSLAGFHQFMHNPNLQQIYRRHPSLKKGARYIQADLNNHPEFQLDYIKQQTQSTGEENYKKNNLFDQPGTLSQLFFRLYEMMSRKSLYQKLKDQKNFKEQYALIMKLFSFTKIEERRNQNEPSEIMQGNEKSELGEEWLDIFEPEEAPLTNIVALARRKGKSEAQAQISSIMDQDTLFFNDSQNKFKTLKDIQTEQSSTYLSIFDKTGISNNLRKVHEKMSCQLRLTSYDKNVQRVSRIVQKSGIEGRPLKLPQL